jgi:hypothetical protein
MKATGKPTPAVSALALLAVACLVVVALAGCLGGDNPADIIDNVEDQARDVARQANLTAINSAIQVYIVEHEGTPPTDINQLAPYLGGKVPTDPLGGTYYVYSEGGETRAGVR